MGRIKQYYHDLICDQEETPDPDFTSMRVSVVHALYEHDVNTHAPRLVCVYTHLDEALRDAARLNSAARTAENGLSFSVLEGIECHE